MGAPLKFLTYIGFKVSGLLNTYYAINSLLKQPRNLVQEAHLRHVTIVSAVIYA